jgi:hypothetical protein
MALAGDWLFNGAGFSGATGCGRSELMYEHKLEGGQFGRSRLFRRLGERSSPGSAYAARVLAEGEGC